MKSLLSYKIHLALQILNIKSKVSLTFLLNLLSKFGEQYDKQRKTSMCQQIDIIKFVSSSITK